MILRIRLLLAVRTCHWRVLLKNRAFSRHHDLLSSPHRDQKADQFTVLYSWPTMRHFRFVSRFKTYQVSTMLLLLGPLSYWYKEGIVTYPQLLYGCTAAIGTTIVLLVLSYGFSKVVGELAFSHSTSTVRISTLTFLGYRRQTCIPLDHIVPYTDCQRKGLSIVQRLETMNPRCVYYYSLRYGQVRDYELLRTVLVM